MKLSHTFWSVFLGEYYVATGFPSCARQGRCIKRDERAISQRKHIAHVNLNRRRADGLVERALEVSRADHSIGRVLREIVAL